MRGPILIFVFLFPFCLLSQSITSYQYDNNFESEGIAKIDNHYYVGAQIASDFVIYKFDESMSLQWTDTIDKFVRKDGYIIDDWHYSYVGFDKNENKIECTISTAPGKLFTGSWFIKTIKYSENGNKQLDSLCYCIENSYPGKPPKIVKKNNNDYYIAWYNSLRETNTEHNTVARVGEYGVRKWMTLLDTLAEPKMHKIDDLAVDTDGNLWITGKMNYDGGGNKPPYLSHVSSEGVELGRYGTNSEKRFNAMRVEMINNRPVVFATWREENESYKHGFEYKVIAYKIENGQLVETGLLFEDPEKDIDIIETVLSTSDGGAIISIASMNMEEVNPKFIFSTKDLLFVKLDSNLNIVWEKHFEIDNEIETTYQAFEESPGRYTFSGKIGDRFSLIKIDETETNVEYQKPIDKDSIINLYDINGKLILEGVRKESLDNNQLKSGVYLMKTGDKTEKLIIAR